MSYQSISVNGRTTTIETKDNKLFINGREVSEDGNFVTKTTKYEFILGFTLGILFGVCVCLFV